MNDILELFFDLNKLGCELPDCSHNLSCAGSWLGAKFLVARKEPGGRDPKSRADRPYSCDCRKSFASFVPANSPGCDINELSKPRDTHARCLPCLPKPLFENFTCVHMSFYHDNKVRGIDIFCHRGLSFLSRSWLKSVKVKKGFSTSDVAIYCDVSERQVLRWLAGSGVSREGQQALARALGPEVLLGFFLESLEKYLKENDGYEKV